ncbi:NAD-dependent epimerase/dehydratase family protein [Pseudomonas chlororaphis]
MKKRLFATGLIRLVGCHIQSRLSSLDSRWDVLPAASTYNLSNPSSLEGLWPELPDAVSHLAGRPFIPEAFRNSARAFWINLQGTLNLLQALKSRVFFGTFIHVSSGDVDGQMSEDSLPIDEHQSTSPGNPYAVNKLSTKFLCLQWGMTEKWPVMVVRSLNHIGAGQKESGGIASAARQIAKIKQALRAPMLEVGDIDVPHDFLDISDVLAAYLALGGPRRLEYTGTTRMTKSRLIKGMSEQDSHRPSRHQPIRPHYHRSRKSPSKSRIYRSGNQR